ncbi:MAG: IPTL-CTERM sorting domain-containing protein, partial [Burkholderiales bacterium]|nr:IPTL-CTERM sorting domain-containing protein [Burkholderiales bacterium]
MLLPFFALPAQAQTNVGTYADLQTACAAAGAGNVTLTADILDGTTQLTIERNLTLDLNGHSLTIDLPAATGRVSNGIKINPNVTLILMDSSPGVNALTVTNRANVTYDPAANSNFGAAINSSEGEIIINSGTVNANGGYTGAGIGGGHNADGGIITINGGTVNANGGWAGAGIGGGGSVGANAGAGGIITINSGTVDARGGQYGAGIGGGAQGNGGIITIAGGTVNAASSSQGTGIGGSYVNANSGIITITGDAVVTARGSGSNAGIGSGRGGRVNSISIDTIGTVTATGSQATASYGAGAAIGQGGQGSQSGNPDGAGISNVTHPAAASVIAPATAAFNVTVAAEGTTPPTLAYQWEVFTGGAFASVTDGAGGTTDSYTTAATTVAMSGNQYRNVITVTNVNGGNTGTITYVTHPATLTVNAASTVIASAAVTVTAPVTGATPNTIVTACGTDFTCGTVAWTPNQDPFEGGTQYTAEVTLTANGGFTFTGLTSATINGNNATATNNTGNTVTLSYAFAATSTAITSAAINVTAPVTGAAPDAAVTTCGTDFVCSAVTWAPADNPFQAGTQYAATITLTASAGYTFTGLAAATINGNAANVIGNTGNTVTLSYEFAATGAPPTVRANLASIPVLNPAMLVLLALALGGLAFRQGRRS